MFKRIHLYMIDELFFLPILLVNWSLWAVSGYHKIHQIVTKKAWMAPDGWIPWLQNHFKGSFLEGFSEPLFFALTFLEVLAGLFLTIAILRMEFFHDKEKDFFRLGLFFGALSIASMSFGQNLVNADDDVFQLSSYLTTTIVSYLFILVYPKISSKKKN